MANVGRPTLYTPEIGIEICTLLAKGWPLTKICKQEGMPDISTVYRWMLDKSDAGKQEFRDMYALAREDQADTLADEIIEIADDSSDDTYEVEIGDGVMIEKENREVVNRSRLRVDARKWVAAKLKPKKYGDYLRQDTKLEGGERPVKIIAVEGYKGFSDDHKDLVDEQKDEESA